MRFKNVVHQAVSPHVVNKNGAIKASDAVTNAQGFLDSRYEMKASK